MLKNFHGSVLIDVKQSVCLINEQTKEKSLAYFWHRLYKKCMKNSSVFLIQKS